MMSVSIYAVDRQLLLLSARWAASPLLSCQYRSLTSLQSYPPPVYTYTYTYCMVSNILIFFSFSSFVCRWISYVCKPCTINFFAILFYCLIKHFNDAMLTSCLCLSNNNSASFHLHTCTTYAPPTCTASHCMCVHRHGGQISISYFIKSIPYSIQFRSQWFFHWHVPPNA
jgi:hypothetical protein